MLLQTDMKSATIKKTEDGRLAITGELDFNNVVEFWQESLVLMKDLNELHFDLSAITHCNSAGIALLLEWIKYARREKKSLSFRNIPQQLLSIAKVTGVDQILQDNEVS